MKWLPGNKYTTLKSRAGILVLIKKKNFSPFVDNFLVLFNVLIDKRRVHFQDLDYSAPWATGAYFLCLFFFWVLEGEKKSREEKRLCIQCITQLSVNQTYC